MKTKEFSRLLFEARKSRGLTQDALCTLIGAGDKSNISKWENGVVVPSQDMVVRIMNVYDEPLLGYIYLQQCTELGQAILPEIVQGELETLTLRFQKEYNDIRNIRMDMIDIACDGVVEDHEKQRWELAQKEIADLTSVSLPLAIQSFIQRKKPLQDWHLKVYPL